VDGRETPGSQSGGGHDVEGVGDAQMTSAPITVIDGVPIAFSEALGAALSLLAVLAALSLVALWRAGSARQREREIADERQEAQDWKARRKRRAKIEASSTSVSPSSTPLNRA
jgi:hypothetical protein